MPTDPPALPGTVEPKRFRPRLAYELLVCGTAGHELVGTDAREIGEEDREVVRAGNEGTRWHRCLRCDSWLPLSAPTDAAATRERPPTRAELELPFRGRALRDRVVLRLIALDRALHFVILLVIGIAVLVFAARQGDLRDKVFRVLADLQGGLSDPEKKKGFLGEIRRAFDVQSGTLTKIGLVILGYALLEGVEAVGLWFQKRWAEYLTFLATLVFIPLEVYELTEKLSVLKLFTFVLNVAVVVYLLLAKRLFGLRGGGAAEHAAREESSGWGALDRATPP